MKQSSLARSEGTALGVGKLWRRGAGAEEIKIIISPLNIVVYPKNGFENNRRHYRVFGICP